MNLATFETVLLVLLVADALALAVLVLLQQGRGADVGAAFGSGASSTVFGSAGSTSFLTRLTVWLAIGFFLISFGLAYTAKERAASLDDLGIPQVPVEGPASTGGPADSPAPAETPATESGELTPPSEGVDSDLPDL